MGKNSRVPPLLGVVVGLGIVMAVFVSVDRRGSDFQASEARGAPANGSATRRSRRAREQEQEKPGVSALVAELRPAYEQALADKALVPPFLTALNQGAQTLSDPSALAFDAANYTTKLLLARLQAGEHGAGEIVVRNYFDNLLVHTGLDAKSLDVAAFALALPQRNELFADIERNILGEGFVISELKHPILLFNLACHYALNADKPKMLEAIKWAMKRGKEREQFMADADFDAYKQDPDFLAALDGQ